MFKSFSDKSKAKSRGLAKIGDKALAAADELLSQEEGRWGYDVEEAEAVQAGDTVAKPAVKNSFANLLNQVAPVIPAGTVVTKHTMDGKGKLAPVKLAAEKPARIAHGNTHKGYTIDKQRETRNGITRQSEGTVGGRIWAEFDANPSITSKDLAAIAAKLDVNATSVSCAFYHWRKFNGVSGRSK
jgi:hypothetical protein